MRMTADEQADLLLWIEDLVSDLVGLRRRVDGAELVESQESMDPGPPPRGHRRGG